MMFGHFSAKNIRFKTNETREMNEFQTSKFQTTEYLCSDTFPPKIFASKRMKRENSKPLGFNTLNIYVRTLFSQKYSLQNERNE